MALARRPDPSALLEALDLQIPLLGFYHAPDPGAFAPLVGPKSGAGRGRRVFDFYRCWLKGETLYLTACDYGCGRAFLGGFPWRLRKPRRGSLAAS